MTLVIEDFQVVIVQHNQAEMEVCKYQRFGFCKFRESCKNEQLVEIFESLSACVNIKSCLKRHPRVCKSYGLENFCKFEAGCAYHHKEEKITMKLI